MGERVRMYHPSLKRTIDVDPQRVPHLERAGWQVKRSRRREVETSQMELPVEEHATAEEPEIRAG